MAKAERETVELTDGLDLGPLEPIVRESNIRQSKFFAEFLNRLVTGRDMHVIITAASETGVGKTTLAASLAILMDQHGWTADKAAVAQPKQYSALYDEVPPGSALLLDEAEKAVDARRGMSKESVNLSQDFATKRYQQVFGLLTAPSKSWVDKRLGGDAADYWIQALQTDMGRVKGEAKVYRLKTNEHYMEDYTTRTEYIHWPMLDWHPEFVKLDERKQQLLESDEESEYIHKDEVQEIKNSVRREAEREFKQEVIENMYERDYSQTEIGKCVGFSQQRVSQILKGG